MYKRYNINFFNPIDAIVPTYDQYGNNTCHVIYSKGASTVFEINVSKFLRLWFQFLRIDLYAQRMWAQEILNQRNVNPIVINENIILIPVKLRKPIGSKDGCYGYIRLKSIQSISPENIYLCNGTKMPYLSSTKTIKDKIKHAKLLRYTYIEERKLHDMIYRKDDTIFNNDSPD